MQQHLGWFVQNYTLYTKNKSTKKNKIRGGKKKKHSSILSLSFLYKQILYHNSDTLRLPPHAFTEAKSKHLTGLSRTPIKSLSAHLCLERGLGGVGSVGEGGGPNTQVHGQGCTPHLPRLWTIRFIVTKSVKLSDHLVDVDENNKMRS